jgi:hypothetical protein
MNRPFEHDMKRTIDCIQTALAGNAATFGRINAAPIALQPRAEARE